MCCSRLTGFKVTKKALLKARLAREADRVAGYNGRLAGFLEGEKKSWLFWLPDAGGRDDGAAAAAVAALVAASTTTGSPFHRIIVLTFQRNSFEIERVSLEEKASVQPGANNKARNTFDHDASGGTTTLFLLSL